MITLVEFEVIIAFGERKPILDLELSRVGYPVHGDMHKKIDISVRTRRCPPRLTFAGAYEGQKTGTASKTRHVTNL